MRMLLAAAALAAFSAQSIGAQPALLPLAVPLPAAIPQPADTPWPGGTMTLDIDATDVHRGLFRVTQTVPVLAGTSRITLLFPQWLPGNHAPRGALAELVDLRFFAEGRALTWKRDPVEVYAFHVDLPVDARVVTAKFIHTSPLHSSEGRVTMTREILNLQWDKMSLYPAGHYVRRIAVRPSVTLPLGWTAASALDGARVEAGRVTWGVTDYETLIDSPIFAGAYFRKWDLGNSVTMSVVADQPEQLEIAPKNLASLNAVVEEVLHTFGTPPFDRYDYLVALSDRIGGIGLEHLRSSESQLAAFNFIDWKNHDWDRNVLPHELAHSWNGKYRRPARMWTPDYRQPMQDDLLWVYEGQTHFWGWVHAARSGVQDKDMVLGTMALAAGQFAQHPGRGWRSLEDTTHDPIVSARKAKPYDSLARREDYYQEGALIWLEADQVIREGTGGKRGLDDFARAFFSGRGGAARQVTYEFADVVAAMTAVYPHDWATFFRDRIERPGRPAPLAGIEKAGYRLVWKEEPNPREKVHMDRTRGLDLSFSLGLSIDSDGDVSETRWDSPAFNAGIVPGARIVAVDQLAYAPDVLKRAITRTKGQNRAIELLIRRGDRFQTVPLIWSGGLRYPWLERVSGQAAAGLDRLLAPKRGSMGQ